MAGNLIFPEWLNSNSVRAYPIAETASRNDITGSFRLPNSLLVAAAINVTPDYKEGVFFVSKVGIFPEKVSVEISYLDAVSETQVIAVVTVDVASHTAYAHYAFVGQSPHTYVVGSLAFGDLAESIASAVGYYEFNPADTPFEVNTVFISTPALKYVEVYNGTSLLASFSKILKLRAGTNIRLSYEGDGTDTIRIDAIAGENLVDPKTCEQALPVPPCIRTINGVAADENGNFTFEPSTCLDIQPGVHRLIFADTCSQSCCGCDELAELVDGLKSTESQINQFKVQLNALQSQTTQLIANILSQI